MLVCEKRSSLIDCVVSYDVDILNIYCVGFFKLLDCLQSKNVWGK